jgi:rhodanese-related sulfurtransferase
MLNVVLALLVIVSKIDNPNIDMEAHLANAVKAAEHREQRRVSEEEFIRMASERGTIVLDARSRDRYDELHVRGAVNLSFPDITAESLARAIPNKNTRILIYCNNNFSGNESAFAVKIAPASLNLSTYAALYSYGYRNVYELGPTMDVQKTKIVLEATKR